MIIPVPESKIDPAGYKSPRPADDVSPKSALTVEAILKNLKVGIGALYVGNIAQPMPIQDYLAAGGPDNVPVFIQFDNFKSGSKEYVSAREMVNKNNDGIEPLCSSAYAAFDGIPADKVEGHIMDLFPDTRNAFWASVDGIASKGL